MLVEDMLEDMKYNGLKKFIRKGHRLLGDEFHLGGITLDKDVWAEGKDRMWNKYTFPKKLLKLKPHIKRWIDEAQILDDDKTLDILSASYEQDLVVKKDYDGFYPKFEYVDIKDTDREQIYAYGEKQRFYVIEEDSDKLESECYKLNIEWQDRTFRDEREARLASKGLDYDRLTKHFTYHSWKDKEPTELQKRQLPPEDKDAMFAEYFEVDSLDYDERTKICKVVIRLPYEMIETATAAVSIPVDKPIIMISVWWKNVGKYEPEHFVDIIKACGVLSFNSLTFGGQYSGHKLNWTEKYNPFW
jgi:hypothetical protein